MASVIDESVPAAGALLSSAEVRANFAAAKEGIETLQTTALTAAALAAGVTPLLNGYLQQGVTSLSPVDGTLTIPFDGKVYALTLTGNITIAIGALPTAPICADTVVILKQRASGAPYTVTWPTGVQWPGATSAAMPTAANARLRLVCSVDPLGVVDLAATTPGVPV